MFCNVVLYCIALPARVLFAIKIIIKLNNDKIRLFMEREVPNFNFMDIKQQIVFLMINKDITIISFISDIVFENFQIREKMV
jgi:hypothetical protein